MGMTVVEEPCIVHALPGRVRVHLPDGVSTGRRFLEARVGRLRGVSEARFSPLTSNVLVRFDPGETDGEGILAALQNLLQEPEGVEEEDAGEAAEAPPVNYERRGPAKGAGNGSGTPLRGRARIAVRGMDRDPGLARRVVERLEDWPTVRASASQLTGRVLVEFDEHRVELEDLAAAVADLELPELPGEDRPTHPMDKEPLAQSGVRTGGAVLGLGVLAGRRMAGATGPPVASSAPAVVANVINVLESFPATKGLLHRILGRNLSELLASTSGIVLQTLSNNPLSLLIAGTGAFRMFTERRARREAWRAYEERVEAAAPTHPGATVRLEPGERAPLPARVLEGAGTAVGRDGLPVPVFPGGEVEAGSKLYGGPFALELRGGEPFAPQARSEPEAGSLRDGYIKVASRASLLAAAATALFTRSFGRTLASLLLVSPRISEIGAQFADQSASARVLRSGVTVAGTRPERKLRKPDVLLLDGPRVLVEGLEVNGVLPRVEGCDASEVLALASGVAAAAGSRWGRAFPAAERAEATDGTFDGMTATAEKGDARYFLGPVTGDLPSDPQAARLKDRGGYLLALRGGGRTLGIVSLRPRLAVGADELVEACERHGVEVALLGGGDERAACAVSRRAKVSLFEGGEGVVEAVRGRQGDGEVVALVSDSAGASEGFAACDLAIGLTTGRSGNFPARADLLAPDLGAVAAIVESGARREKAVRDSVLLSAASNVFGLALPFLGPVGAGHASLAALATILGTMVSGWARLRGGNRPRSAHALVSDPRPERWGRQSVEEVLEALESDEGGAFERGG